MSYTEKQIQEMQESMILRLDEIRTYFIEKKDKEGFELIRKTIEELREDLYIPNDEENKIIQFIEKGEKACL